MELIAALICLFLPTMLGLIIGAALRGSLVWRLPLAVFIALAGLYPSFRAIRSSHDQVTLLAMEAMFYGIAFLVGTFQEPMKFPGRQERQTTEATDARE